MEEDLIEDDEEETSCASCLSVVVWEEDVVLAQVIFPFSENDEDLTCLKVYMAEDGEPVYPPLFLCFSCFEEMLEHLRLFNKDQPPKPLGDAAVACDCCGSGIPFQESCVRFDHGEIVQSKKTHLPKFAPNTRAPPYLLCLSCAIQLTGTLEANEEEEYGELWADLANTDECPRCTFDRCWHHISCPCSCHL